MKKISKISIGIVIAIFSFGLAGPTIALAATAPNLGTAASFSVFAGSAMTADGSGATISADLGVNPGLSVSGPWTVGGTSYFGTGGLSGTAKTDATTAWTTIGSGGGTVWDPTVDLTPVPGLYTRSGDATITGELKLNGTASDVWIFQINDSLTFTNAATVTLGVGVNPCNVFWRIASSATINGSPTTKFVGTLIANSDVSLVTGATVIGRMMALTGTLSTAGITNISGCAVGTTPSTISSGGTGAHYFAQMPGISITKTPSPLSLPVGSGPVTYTYKVSNTGIVALATVWVKDNKCSPTQYVSGDKNGNGLLDLTETWTYNCFKTVSQTETNIATAHGWGVGLGIDVYDTATATVVVSPIVVPPVLTPAIPLLVPKPEVIPGFPNTGLPPRSTTPWDIFITAGILMVVSSSLVLALRKR